MRYIFFLLAVAITAACNSNNTEQKAKPAVDSTMLAAMPAKNFSSLDFAYKKDPVCHMPLTAGIVDTATFKGKLYGFCSVECKNEFIKDQAGYIAKIKQP